MYIGCACKTLEGSSSSKYLFTTRVISCESVNTEKLKIRNHIDLVCLHSCSSIASQGVKCLPPEKAYLLLLFFEHISNICAFDSRGKRVTLHCICPERIAYYTACVWLICADRYSQQMPQCEQGLQCNNGYKKEKVFIAKKKSVRLFMIHSALANGSVSKNIVSFRVQVGKEPQPFYSYFSLHKGGHRWCEFQP